MSSVREGVPPQEQFAVPLAVSQRQATRVSGVRERVLYCHCAKGVYLNTYKYTYYIYNIRYAASSLCV